MLIQTLIVALLVLGCAVYATWTLLPAAARRTAARALLKRRLPEPLAARLRKHSADSAGACGCDGCDHSAKKTQAATGVQTIRIHRRSAS
jgi:hypothetical protein